MYSFYISPKGRDAIVALATERGQTQADTIRAMLGYAAAHMPTHWHG